MSIGGDSGVDDRDPVQQGLKPGLSLRLSSYSQWSTTVIHYNKD